MFQGFSGATVDFMWGIRFNNEKGWFEAHKEEYLTTFQRPMKALADEVYVAFTDRHPELGPEGYSYGMGFWQAPAVTMAKFRARMDREPKVMEKLARRFQKQDVFVLEGEDYKRPKAAPSRLLTPWYSKKSFALSHDAPHGEPLWSHDLVDLLLEGYEFLLPYYEYMLSLSGDPDPRAQ